MMDNCFQHNNAHRDLHSFPTRRSSDLRVPSTDGGMYAYARHEFGDFAGYMTAWCYWITCWAGNAAIRSEEHTSELQSRRDLVCRLLLEKKNRTSQLAARLRWRDRENVY